MIDNQGLIYSINNEDKTSKVIGCQSNGELFIPRSINYNSQEYIIISISDNAFYDLTGIISIQFASDSALQTIEKKAFYNTAIENITLPSSLLYIGELSFAYCKKLHQIKILKDSKLQTI